ncbi:MAG: hypothetical protein GDA36_07270 [Rhodobacteraceae bacterium]|nr:hypothetical protein [Paracoccaceae bacterium]
MAATLAAARERYQTTVFSPHLFPGGTGIGTRADWMPVLNRAGAGFLVSGHDSQGPRL